MPFLTEVDSRAAVKGSRDPLGFVPIWSHFGRYVVGNLSTVSNSARGFTTLLLGYYFAQEAHERGTGDVGSTLELFIKFEQLAGYSRYHVYKDGEFRGIDRVKLALSKGSKVVLGAATDCQILSSQKTYGLWGLFSVPAKASGLLLTGELALTPVAREFVEHQYIARLSADGFRNGRAIVDLLSQPRAELRLDGQHAGLVRAVANLLRPKFSSAEQTFYVHHLVQGGDGDETMGRQRQLADLLRDLPQDSEFGMDELRGVLKVARQRGESWEPLVDRLESIERLETLLVPAASAFAFCLARNDQAITKVAAEIRKCWGASLKHVHPQDVAEIKPIIASALNDERSADRLLTIAHALAEGAYESAIRLLIEHNTAVMQTRSGAAPWVRLNGNRLDVRLRDEASSLPDGSELPHLWRNTYFINSLERVQVEVAEA